MEFLKLVCKCILKFRDVIELYAAIASLIGMFLMFLLQIFMRYIMRSPLAWAPELISTGFMWLVLLGACYTHRKKKHVSFTLVYDLCSIRWKAFLSLLGNLLIVVAFTASFIPTWEFIQFMQIQRTVGLRISMHIIYMPYMIFLTLIIIYTSIDVFNDFMVLSGLDKGKRRQQMLEAATKITESEVKPT